MLTKMHDIGLAAEAAAALPDGGFDVSLVPAEEPADPAVLAMPGDDAAKVRAASCRRPWIIFIDESLCFNCFDALHLCC
jgi:hypothetical protein